MSGSILSPDGLFGWWLWVIVAVLLLVAIAAFQAWWLERERRIRRGPAFEGESVFDIARSEPEDLGPGFEFEATGGFRRRGGSR